VASEEMMHLVDEYCSALLHRPLIELLWVKVDPAVSINGEGPEFWTSHWDETEQRTCQIRLVDDRLEAKLSKVLRFKRGQLTAGGKHYSVVSCSSVGAKTLIHAGGSKDVAPRRISS